MVMVMVIVMVVEGVIDYLPQEEMAMMMEHGGGDDSPATF